MAMPAPIVTPQSAIEAGRALAPHALALPDPADPGFGAHFDHLAEARIVLLGEATHGTSEFYRARAAISRRLIEHHGFNILAIEADWPDADRIDRHVRHRDPGANAEPAFARFPAWMWRNVEFDAFIDWLRAHNDSLRPERRCEVRGLDVYSLRSSMTAVIDYLDETDPDAAIAARRRYGCLTPWQSEPAWYGRAVMRGEEDPCEPAIIEQLCDMLGRRMVRDRSGNEALFDATQNARIVHAAERYYRIMYGGGNDSWNLRDRHMFETLERLLAHRGPEAKAIVWAHNSHIGDASATEMGWRGQFNIGELSRKSFGEGAYLLGFGTDRGTVAAADDWDEPMQVKSVLPSRMDSYERVMRQTGLPRALVTMRSSPAATEILAEPRLERAIGVIYRPETELQSHYFEAVLPDQFDGFVWFEETAALTPLAAPPPAGVPETYPFGV